MLKKLINLYILEKLEGIGYDCLQKSSFNKYMLIEAHGLAQLQIASELADYEENLVLQSDGTSKKSHSFTTFNVSKSNGQFHVLGLCEVGSGDAETQLHILEEVVGDVNEFTKKVFLKNFSCQAKI